MQDNENAPEDNPIDQGKPVISHLWRREIQAPVAACLIRGFAEVIGEEKALEIAADAIREDARNAGKLMARKLDGNGLAELHRIVEEVWAEGEAVTVRLLEKKDKSLGFDVTRCRYAEMYEAMGRRDLGFCLSCSRDTAFARLQSPHPSVPDPDDHARRGLLRFPLYPGALNGKLRRVPTPISVPLLGTPYRAAIRGGRT